jgi:DHA1 family bicyclomycin/chloramphenicol resistance-like MFS transporter
MEGKFRASAAPVNQGRLTLILGALTAFAPFATDMYLSSFPHIARDLDADPGQVQLTLSVFFFGLAAGQLVYGPLIDRYGRRWPLLAGITLFIVCSGLVVVVPDILGFVALRLLQAVGGCAGMIISRAIIGDLFEWKAAARMLSSLMVVQSLGPILAPILGGYILTYSNWRMIFWFQVLFGALCLVAVMLGIPETLPAERRRCEGPGKMLRVFGMLLIRRDFIVPTLAGSLAMAEIFAFISGSPFVLMTLHGCDQQEYGWLFGLYALGMTVMAYAGRILLRHFSPRQLYAGALTLNLALAAALNLVAQTSSLTLLMLPMCLGLAMNPLIGATSTALAMDAGHDASGSASAIIGVTQFGLAGLASALVGLLHNGTPYPMTGVILGASLGACLVSYCGRRRVEATAE